MNEGYTTIGGYYGSKMVGGQFTDNEAKTGPTGTFEGGTLDEIYDKYIKPDFETGTQGKHIVTYESILTDTVDEKRSNQFGNDTGASSNWAWYERKLDLMSEVTVYGTTISSSSFYDTGIDDRQYAIFQLKPEFINSYKNYRFTYWLKDVVSSAYFAGVNYRGAPLTNGANGSFGVRPRFLID